MINFDEAEVAVSPRRSTQSHFSPNQLLVRNNKFKFKPASQRHPDHNGSFAIRRRCFFCLHRSTDVTKALPRKSSRVWTQSLWGHFWKDYSAASFKKSNWIFYQASVPWWWCHPSEAPSRFNWIPSWGEKLPSEGAAADLPATFFVLTMQSGRGGQRRWHPCCRRADWNQIKGFHDRIS